MKYFNLMIFFHSAQAKSGGRRDLVLVLEGDLYLVPFSVLRPGPGFTMPNNSINQTQTQGSNNSVAQSISEVTEYLCERFSLISVPSLSALKGYKGTKSKSHSDSHQTGINSF